MKKLLGGLFQKTPKDATAQTLSPPPVAAPKPPGQSARPAGGQERAFKHGPRSSWDTFFQSPTTTSKMEPPSPPLPATAASVHVPAKVFNQNLEILMREIAAKIKDVITKMIEDAEFQADFAQLCGFINLAADKLLEKGDPSLILLKNYFSSPAGSSLCEQTALPSLVLDFVNKVRIYVLKNELRHLEAAIPDTPSSTDSTSTRLAPTTAAELERPIHFLMSCVQAIASNFSLMEQFRCELPNVIHLIAEDYPRSAIYIRNMCSQVLVSISDKNFNAGLVWYLNDCNIVARTVKMMSMYTEAAQATPQTAAAALRVLAEMTKSCIADSSTSVEEPIAAAVSDALGLSRNSEAQPNETRESTATDTLGSETSLEPREGENARGYRLVGAYDPAPGFKCLVYTLQKTCRFSLVLLGEFQSSGGYGLLSDSVKRASESEVSTLIYIYTLLLPLGTGFSGVCGEDENMATVSTCGARNIGAFLSMRDLVLDCMSGLKSASEFELKAHLELLLLQLLTTILQVYTSAYDNFVCLELKTQALAMILSRLPSIAFFDAQVIILRIVEYVCAAARVNSPLPIEILAVLCSQFIEFSAAEVLELGESIGNVPRTEDTKHVAPTTRIESRAGLVCECIIKILQTTRVPAYRDELHSFGLLERGVYALLVKVASSMSANTSQPIFQQQYLAVFKSRISMWSSMVCLMLKENPPLMAEFREMQIHHSLYVIADVMVSDEASVAKKEVNPPVFPLFVVLATVSESSDLGAVGDEGIAKLEDLASVLQAGIESDLTKLLELLQRVRSSRQKQEFIMDVCKQMLRGRFFWDAWLTCQGHEILLSLLSSFQNLNREGTSDEDFLLLDGILEMIGVTLDPSCQWNQRSIEHFADDIGYATLASCLLTSGVMETGHWTSALGRVFELITGLEAPRNKIRNPKAVEMLFTLLPSLVPEQGEACLARLLAKITSNDDISFSKKKQISSLVQAGIFRWIAQTSIIAILCNASCPSQKVLLQLITEISREELGTSHLREYIRVIAKCMPLLLSNHHHPSKALEHNSDGNQTDGVAEEVGLRLLRMALKGSPVPQVAVGTNVRTKMTSGYVHVANQSDLAWPSSSGYSFSCWLRLPPIDKIRRASCPADQEVPASSKTVCVALCEGPLEVKLDGDEAATPEAYCVLVGAELSLFESSTAARDSYKPKEILTVTAVAPNGPNEFFIWCHDKRYVARNPGSSSGDTDMWVRALQQSEYISSRATPLVKATAEGGNRSDVLYFGSSEDSTPELSEESGLEGFVCLLSAYSAESSGCFTRLYFDQASGCLRIDTGSASAGPTVNPASKRTSVVFKNVSVDLLRSESNAHDEPQESKEKPSQWHHVAVTHRKSALGNSQVTLYIDGAEVATKKLAYPSSPSAGGLQAFIGKDIQICGTYPALPWQLGPTWFIEDVLPANAIVCIFLLGPAFRGQFGGHAYRSIGDWPEAIATNQLDRATKRRVEVSRAARRAQLPQLSRASRRQWYEATTLAGEVQPGNAFSDLLSKKDDQSESSGGVRTSESKKRQLKLGGFSTFVNAECAMSAFGLEILDVLSGFKLSEKDIYFSINTSFDALRDSAPAVGLRPAAQVNFIGTEPSVPLDLAKVLPSLGGVTQFLLPLIDNSWRSHELGVSLKLLARCNRRNPSCLAELLDINGYAIVASTLRSRIHLIDGSVLRSVVRLAVSGTLRDSGKPSSSSSLSFAFPVVVNFAALSQVVLSQHLRQLLPPRYQLQLMTHIQHLLDSENSNAIFNARQLRQASFLSWILLFIADVCNCDHTVSDAPEGSGHGCFPTFKEDVHNEVFAQLIKLLVVYLRTENHVEDVVVFSDMLLVSFGNQKPFVSTRNPFRVAILQFLLRELEDSDGKSGAALVLIDQRHGRDGMKPKKDEADPFGVAMVDSVLPNGSGALKKRKDRGEGGLSMLVSPTSTTAPQPTSDPCGNSLVNVLCEVIRRNDSGKYAKLEALLSTRILLTLAQSHTSFARYLFQTPGLLEKLKRVLHGHSADCNFYTPILALISNIPIRETRYYDQVLVSEDPEQFALPSPNGFINGHELDFLEQVWDLLGSMLNNNSSVASEAAEKASVVVLKQLSFHVEVSEGFFSTVCQFSFTLLRALALCLLCRPGTSTTSADSTEPVTENGKDRSDGVTALDALLSGYPPRSRYGVRAHACLTFLKVFFTRSLFEREDFAMNVMFLLECIDDEIERFPVHSPDQGQKCWLALVVHTVKQTKALSDNCSFLVLRNMSTLTTALARYLLDDAKHRDQGTGTASHGPSLNVNASDVPKSAQGGSGSSCFGTDILVFLVSTVRMCAEAHVGQVVGVEDQQFFYGCFVYCAQVVLLSELGGLHKCTSPSSRLLDCLVNSRHFFVQQTKVSGVIICSSGHQYHSAQVETEPGAATGGAPRGLNVHLNKMKSLAAAAHREFGIGAESDRSFLLSLAAELLRWLVDDSERVRHTSITIWQFLFQQRMGVIKELLIVEPKVSLLQNMSSNKKDAIDVFHGGFDRLLKISPPRTSSDVSAARISSGELSASHESWLQFHIWLTENYDLLKELIVTRTEPILQHMIEVLESCEFVRKVSSSSASNRTTAQADVSLNLDFPRHDHNSKMHRSPKITTVEEDDQLDMVSCRVAMRKAQLKYSNAEESCSEDMQDAVIRWRDTSTRLQHTRAIWHMGGWNEVGSIRAGGGVVGSSSRTSSGPQARNFNSDSFYLERSVFQQNSFHYRLDFTEGPQRMRLRMIRGYASEIENAASASAITTSSKEQPTPSIEEDPLQRKLEFHQCVEAYREFVFRRSKVKLSTGDTRTSDSSFLNELAGKSNVPRVKDVIQAAGEMEDQLDCSAALATKIYNEFLEGDKSSVLHVSPAVAEAIISAISSAHNVAEPVELVSTLFDVADLEAMQATLNVAGMSARSKALEADDSVEDSDEDDDDDSRILANSAVGTPPLLSDSEDSASDDDENAKRTSSNEKARRVTESARAMSLRLAVKGDSGPKTADGDLKTNVEAAEKVFESSSDYVYGGIVRFLHRDDYPPMRSYNAAYVAGMSKTMGIFLVCPSAIYFVGGYGKLFSEADSGTGTGFSSATPSSQPGTSVPPNPLSPTKTAVGKKKTKDLIRETFADIGISLPGAKNSDSPLYTIVPLGNSTPGDAQISIGSSQLDNTAASVPIERWSIKYSDMRQFYRIKYQLRPVGIEFFDTFGSTFFVQFESLVEREDVVKLLFQMPIVNSVFWNPLLRSSALSLSVKRIRQNLTKRWLKGGISNFEYLMHLNTLAGRSFNDITQYPVFPWVVADYNSRFLDLETQSTFRDLTKPMGALGDNRAALFRERYAAMNYDAAHSAMDSPAFHYGTHYSCSAYVVNYLIRMEPFSQLAKELQGGSFDHADRLFRSIPSSWHSASTENLQDVRELIPEFFFLPEFLYNANNYDLGTTQGGEVVSHVKLPAWAHGDPREFIRIHRRALESKYVSENLHHWIDLVFGYKQTGAAALDAQNVFMHFTYEGAVDLDAIDDPVMRNAMLAQIENFGQTPSKLFTTPHPSRKVPSLASVHVPQLLTGTASTSTPPGIGQPYDGNTIGSVEAFVKWHTPLAPALISIGKDYVFLRKHSSANILEAPAGSVRVVGDKFQCRGLGCTFMPPRFTKYLEWGSNTEGTMKLRVHSSSARHREANKVVGVVDGAHHSLVNCAAFSDDGVVLVTGGQDAVVNVLECSKAQGQRQFKQIAKLVGHDDAVTSVAINRPFNLVASASKDGCVILWDLRTRMFMRELVGHSGAVIQVAINSMSGNIVACSSGELRLWSINGDLLATTTMQAVGLSAMTSGLSTNCESWQDGIFAVTGHSNGTVALWGLRFPSDIAAELQEKAGGLEAPNSRHASSSSYSSGTLKNAARIGVARPHSFTGAGSSGGEPTILKAIPTCQFLIKKLLVDHRTAITALHLVPDQRQLLSADADGLCIRWVDDSVSAYAL